MDQINFTFAQRWHDHREFRITPGSCILPNEFGVDVIPEREARHFVIQHHYSGSMPATRLSVGLFRKTGVHPARLVGVAVFSVPMNQRAIPRYTGFNPLEGVELGRFVCAPEVAYNGESYFIRRALAFLQAKKPMIRAVLTYADPMKRRNKHGEMVKCSHHRTIYQASNALYLGKGSKRTLILAPNGSVISERSLSKIRNQESGHLYASQALIAAGAPPREPGEDPKSWVSRALADPAFRRVPHLGNHVYILPMDARVRRELSRRTPKRPPYPKKDIGLQAA